MPTGICIRLPPTLRGLLILHDAEVVTMRACSPLVKRPERPKGWLGRHLACNPGTSHLLGAFVAGDVAERLKAAVC